MALAGLARDRLRRALCDDPAAPAAEIGRTQELLARVAHADRLFRPSGGGGNLDNTGATNITGGSLELVSPGALTTSSLSVSNGATLTLDSGSTISTTPPLTNNGTATFKNTADTVAALNGAGTLNLTPTALTVTNGGSFSGLIASSGSLTVCNACWYSTTRWPWWACQADSPCT